MIHYVLQLIGFQLLFLLVYDLFLKRETFFQWNRTYLLLTPLLSTILPLLQFTVIQKAIPSNYVINLPAVLIGTISSEGAPIVLEEVTIIGTAAPAWSLFELISFIWIFGALVSLVFFGIKCYKLFRLKQKSTALELNGFNVRVLPKTTKAFSFFNTIFLGSDLSEAQKITMLQHEEIHIRQRHSVDMLYFELLRILFWFNPAVYVFQQRMTLLQEYIADAAVTREKSKALYYQDLLAQVFNTESISFINTFFNHSLIKKRITMLQKSKSKRIVQLKYLLLVPIVATMLVYTACTNQASAQGETTSQQYVTNTGDSEIIQRVNELLEAVAKNGGISEEEKAALKSLQVLTSEEGVNHPNFNAVQDKVNLPIGVLDKVPTYPGCEGDNEALKSCLAQKIGAFVGEKFNTKVAGKEVTGKQRIVVNFKIDTSGKVADIRADASVASLQDEATRVVAQLPQMLPGEKDGKKVGVMYTLPIIFDLK